MSTLEGQFRPERTAMSRDKLSAPARRALLDGLFDECSVLDYGCGRGGDVRRLLDLGIDARGWDPHYRPHPDPSPADVVTCFYVLNVIAEPTERVASLQRAWSLAERMLIVAVRGTGEADSLSGEAYRDGTVTGRGTFHHLFDRAELRTTIIENLGVTPVPVGPGLMYVFRSGTDRARYLSRRYGGVESSADSADVLTRLSGFLSSHGRAPVVDEDPALCRDAQAAYGQLARAVTLARDVTEPRLVELAATRRRRELVLILALERFHGGPLIRELPADRLADLRHNYPNSREALREADRLLWATGQMEHIRAAVRNRRVGKTSPTALYVHVDAIEFLSPLLRLYIACAEMVVAREEATNLLKLHHDRAAVSFLSYPRFDRDAHPRLAASVTVDLPRLRATWTDWSQQSNKPLLHRKEEFLHFSDPRYPLYQRLTRSEVRAGLYAQPERIGRENGWEAVLAENGRVVRGHRLLRSAADSPTAAGAIGPDASDTR